MKINSINIQNLTAQVEEKKPVVKKICSAIQLLIKKSITLAPSQKSSFKQLSNRIKKFSSGLIVVSFPLSVKKLIKQGKKGVGVQTIINGFKTVKEGVNVIQWLNKTKLIKLSQPGKQLLSQAKSVTSIGGFLPKVFKLTQILLKMSKNNKKDAVGVETNPKKQNISRVKQGLKLASSVTSCLSGALKVRSILFKSKPSSKVDVALSVTSLVLFALKKVGAKKICSTLSN